MSSRSAARPIAGRPGVLLAIHLDTVYPPGSATPRLELADGGRLLRGPGVADAKGGLAVMLVALEAFERFGQTERLGWEVFINADEELGSPARPRCSRPGGGPQRRGAALRAGPRPRPARSPGPARARATSRSSSAAAPPTPAVSSPPAATRSATAARLAGGLRRAQRDSGRDLTVNVAALHGGEAFNVVPDLAVLRLNIRVATAADADWATARLRAARRRGRQPAEGFSATLHGGFHCPPKPLRRRDRAAARPRAGCGRDLGLTITAEPTGGVCDGNKLAAAGLPNVDTLGVRGGGIHGPEEYLMVESLTERAKLTALVLADLAEGGLPPCS